MPRALLPALLALAALAGCGSSSSGRSAGSGASEDLLPAAARTALAPRAATFPPAGGRSLQALADTIRPGLLAPLAAQTFPVGRDRVPFALLDAQGRPAYGPTAVYVAAGGGKGRARGPFLAPGDSLVTDPAYRSRTSAADPGDIKLVYSAQVPFPKAGRWAVLTITRTPKGLVGAATSLKVGPSRVVAVGDRAPRIATDTLASTHGRLALVTTREPPEDMHATSLRDVLGKRPVALLFSTPALCQSRVCGPVTDVMTQLQKRYAGRVEFIHQEVYRDNQIKNGVRPQLTAFGLSSEPWLFTIDRRGRVAARVEGAFGFAEARRALDAALR